MEPSGTSRDGAVSPQEWALPDSSRETVSYPGFVREIGSPVYIVDDGDMVEAGNNADPCIILSDDDDDRNEPLTDPLAIEEDTNTSEAVAGSSSNAGIVMQKRSEVCSEVAQSTTLVASSAAGNASMVLSGITSVYEIRVSAYVVFQTETHWKSARTSNRLALGLLFGKQEGWQVKLTNTWQLTYRLDGERVIIDAEYLKKALTTYATEHNYDPFVGWYCVEAGSEVPTTLHADIQTQLADIANNALTFIKFTPTPPGPNQVAQFPFHTYQAIKTFNGSGLGEYRFARAAHKLVLQEEPSLGIFIDPTI